MAMRKPKSTETFARLDKLRKDASYPLTVRIPMDLKLTLDRLAEKQHRRASELVRQFIAEGLDRER